MPLGLSWTPNEGGLLLVIPDEELAAFPCPPPPEPDQQPVRELHLTLLSRRSLAALAALPSPPPLPEGLLERLPPPTLRLLPGLHRADRPASPERPLGKRSYFQVLDGQGAWAAWTGSVLAAWQNSAQHVNPALWPAAEAGRLYHLSRFNRGGGAPLASVGDVGWADLAAPAGQRR